MTIEQKILSVRRAEPAWTRKLGRYYASEIFDIWKGNKKPEDFFSIDRHSDDTLMIFEIGKMYHNHVQSFFSEAEKEVRTEMTFESEVGPFVISGRVDLLPEPEKYPVELKSCSNLPASASKNHQSQCRFYINAFDKPHGYVTYLEKNPKKFNSKNYKVDRDRMLFEQEVEAVRQFHVALTKLQTNNVAI